MNSPIDRRFNLWRPSTVSSLLILLLPVLAGCNSGQLPVHPVNGTVRFDDGARVMFGDIEFFSAAHKINARGKINRDGTFEVGTYAENDGAVAGNHKVIILQVTGDYLTEKLSDEIDHDHGELIHPAYFDYRTSNLQCEIVPGPNDIELVVRKNPRQTSDGLPLK